MGFIFPKMKSGLYEFLRVIYSHLGSLRYGDMITINKNGYWSWRSLPAKSLKKTARLFNQLKGETIVEIGTGLHGLGAGNSILNWLKKTSAKKIYAVDIDEQRIESLKNVFSKKPRISLEHADGEKFLKKFQGKIDLLYLDFWTIVPHEIVEGNGRAESHKAMYLAAKNKMSEHSLILIDDTDHVGPWKHTLIVPEARKDGFIPIYTGRQTLLKR
jgi:hypothetical protein